MQQVDNDEQVKPCLNDINVRRLQLIFDTMRFLQTSNINELLLVITVILADDDS
jgi:hypothetical protein